MEIEKKGPLKYLRVLLFFAGTLGIIQSLVWMLLTIFGIVVHSNCNILIEDTNAGRSGQLLRELYFLDETCGPLDFIKLRLKILSPYEIFTWECIFLAIYVIWLFVSLILILKVKGRAMTRSVWFIHTWVYYTIGVCAVDIALGALFGRDVEKINKYLNGITSTKEQVYLLTIYKTWAATMMTIVLQGFLLLIIDLTLCIYFLVCIFKIHKALRHETKKDNGSNYLSREPIRAFDPSIEARSSRWLAGAEMMDRPHLYEPNPTTSVHNRSFQGETNPAFQRSNSNINRFPEHPRTAGIIKSQPKPFPPPWERSISRSGEHNVPTPDYSPPPSSRSKLSPLYIPPNGQFQGYK